MAKSVKYFKLLLPAFCDFFSVVTLLGLLLNHAACPVSLVELGGRLRCNISSVIPGMGARGWVIGGVDKPSYEWLETPWTVISIFASLSLLMMSRGLWTYAQSRRWWLAAVPSLVFLPWGMLFTATPNCADEILLHDVQTTHVTMGGCQNTTLWICPTTCTPKWCPSYERAVLRSTDAVVDDAGHLQAFGITLSGCAAAGILVYHVFQSRRWQHAAFWSIDVLVLMILSAIMNVVGGAVIVDWNHHDAKKVIGNSIEGSTTFEWSKVPWNVERVRQECTSGSGAVVGRPLAASSRDSLFRLIEANLYIGGGVLALSTVSFLDKRFKFLQRFPLKIDDRCTTACLAICWLLYVINLICTTCVLSQAVMFGSNPQCAENLFKIITDPTVGFLILAYSWTPGVLYAIVAPAWFSRQTWVVAPDTPDSNCELSMRTEVAPDAGLVQSKRQGEHTAVPTDSQKSSASTGARPDASQVGIPTVIVA